MDVTVSKSDKPKKKKRKRKSKDASEDLEVETPQLEDDNSLEEHSHLDVYGASAINAQIEEPLAEEHFVVEYLSKTKHSRKANGTAPKRKRAPKSKATVSPADEAEAMDEEGNGAVTNQLIGTSPSRKTIENVKPKKSRQAVVDPDLELESIDNADAETMTRTLSMQDLLDLPQRIKKAKKSKARRITDEPPSKPQEDDNDSAAPLHQPLTPAHVPHVHHEMNTQEANLTASSQLQRDAGSTPCPELVNVEQEEDIDNEPKQPSKKALGKRKAVDEPVSRGSNKKSKSRKDKESADRDLRAFGFMAERLFQEESRASPEEEAPSTSQPGPTTPRPSWNAINSPAEPDAGNESDQSLFVPQREETASPEFGMTTAKSSTRKRRLHVDEPGPSNSTPATKSQPTSAKPKAKTPKKLKTNESVVAKQLLPVTSTKGKLSIEELDAVSSAVESYRIHHNLSQHQVNELIQGDAQLKVAQDMWKNICDEVPDIPRRSVQNTCRRRFHNFEARGAWTEEQDEELRRVYDEHPGKWKLIGETLNRFPEDVRDRWRNYLVCGDTLKKDAWDIEEEEHLRGAVKQCIKEARDNKRLKGNKGTLIDEESLIDWQKVSENMGRTRSRLQCRNKWKKLKDRADACVDDPVAKKPISQSWRLEEAASQARLFSAEEKLALLRAIRDSGAAREGKIPWQTIKDDLNGQGKRMAWKYCFRKLRDRVPDHEVIDFKNIVAHLVDVFETAAPDDPQGLDLPIESFPAYKSPNKKESQAKYRQRQREKNGNGAGPSTPGKRKGRVHKQDESEDSEDSGDGAERSSTVRTRRVRDRMLKEGEFQESANSHGETSVYIGEDVLQSFQSLKRAPTTNGKRTIRKSKRNQALSEEKVVEEPSDDEEPLVNGYAPEANEDEMDIDHEDTYTTTGGPVADEESDDEASNEQQNEPEDLDVDVGRTSGYHNEGSPDLDTPVKGRSFHNFGKYIHLNGHHEGENASVSSDGDVSDIPARRQPREESIEL